MKIAYLDFNEDNFFEDYSISPKRYGGGRIFASSAKDFHIFANPESFNNLTDSENKSNCHSLKSSQRQDIRIGLPIERIIPEIEDFDLIVHHHANYGINSNKPVCCWAVGYNEPCHPRNSNLLLFNEYQKPRISNPNTKTYKVVIGKKIPEFREYPKEDFIFQCTRHVQCFGSIQVAKICKANNIPVVFAGPIIDNEYPLMDYVDGSLIKYIGQISEEEKISYLKKAKLCTFLHFWPTPFNLSAIESLSYGTPIATTNIGFWPSLVNKKNGSILDSSLNLVQTFYNKFNQYDCYESSLEFSEDNMLTSFFDSFERILKNN